MIGTIFLIFSMIVLAIITIFLILLFLEALFIVTEYICQNSEFIDFITRKIQNRKR
nr:MAG TPA: hypothetical protein [Caudoviricetes sp.]